MNAVVRLIQAVVPEPVCRVFKDRQRTTDREMKELGDILGLPASELDAVRLGSQYYYRPFTVPKRNGDRRQILAPSPSLKALQRRLLARYLSRLPAHPSATAFVRGGSTIANARLHAGQAVIATTDIQDFFLSTTANRVRQLFLELGWHGRSLATLMRICVYRDALPQGAPTSPCLSNLVNVQLDQALSNLARRSGATYTRYADDITFSWPTDDLPSSFKTAVRKQLLCFGYRMQPDKGWQVRHVRSRPEINGIALAPDGRLHLPKRVQRHIKQLQRQTRWSQDNRVLIQLQGYKGYARHIDTGYT